MGRLAYMPLLRAQRELLDVPRGPDRFAAYLDAILGGTEDIVRPLAVFNPMARPHVAGLLDSLLAKGAEEAARNATAEADARLGEARLGEAAGDLRVGLVVADDAPGGWTNRSTTDAEHRFGNSGEDRRGFATVLLWASETQTRLTAREAVLASIYRTRYRQRHGRPGTLGQMLTREGLAAVFAGETSPALAGDDLDRARTVIAPTARRRRTP